MNTPVPPRVAINAIFLLPGMGGLDTYVRELVPELVRLAPQTRFSVYCSPAGREHLARTDWASEVELISHPLFGVSGLKAITELTVLGALAGTRADLLHSVALTAPLWTRAVNVVTIADTTWMYGTALDGTTRLWRLVVPPVARRADRLIAISRAGAQDITRHLRIPADRIDITLLGHARLASATIMPEVELRRRFGLGDGPLVLTVGTRKPHKNVLGLIAALPEVLEHEPHARLVLAGNPTAHERELRAAVRDHDVADAVSFLPFVEEDALEGLYAAAECFVLPSFNEGFGLPLLEAMGRGVPVACSNVSALPEVAGDAARYFDPGDSHQIGGALIDLLGDRVLREQLAARGRAREAELTWGATALATLESYARAWAARRSAGTS
ncbi:MAG: glycosyltransferase family 1 protein [Solirubrobacteraceae bacterium]